MTAIVMDHPTGPARPPTDPPMTRGQRNFIMVLSKEIGLTRAERLDLAEFLLSRDMATIRHVSRADAGRIIDALQGYQMISQLIADRAGNATSTHPDCQGEPSLTPPI